MKFVKMLHRINCVSTGSMAKADNVVLRIPENRRKKSNEIEFEILIRMDADRFVVACLSSQIPGPFSAETTGRG